VRTLSEDIDRSLRALVKRPAFFVVAVVTPTSGIGANIALFLVNRVPGQASHSRRKCQHMSTVGQAS